MNKALFLDRDGTINVDVHFLKSCHDLELIDGAMPALKRAYDQGYLLFIISNQSGIARGLLTEQDAEAVNSEINKQAQELGFSFKEMVYCPHYPTGTGDRYDQTCECRKPNVALIERLITTYNIDPSLSYMVGDKESDIMCGQRVNCHSVLVLTGKGRTVSIDQGLKNHHMIDSLADIANVIR
jgi:D-glycero-D-manno-heptose 1,7-bisphosphate phosphatase